MIRGLATEVGSLLGVKLDAARYLVINNKFGKRAVFLYEESAREPSYVVRIPLGDLGLKQCEREYQNLKKLEELNFPDVGFPRPATAFMLDKRKCFVQTTVYAPLLTAMLPLLGLRNLKKRDFYWITDKLVQMYLLSQSQQPSAARSWRHCFQHGDFWMGNLGRKGRRLIMYDLEFGNPAGWPLQDLLHFGLIFQVATNNIGKLRLKASRSGDPSLLDGRAINPDIDAFNQAFLGRAPLAKLMRECIRRYLSGCNIERDEAIHLAWGYFSGDRKIAFPSMTYLSRIFGE